MYADIFPKRVKGCIPCISFGTFLDGKKSTVSLSFCELFLFEKEKVDKKKWIRLTKRKEIGIIMVNAKDSARGENGEFSDMYNGYSMIENKLELHFFGSASHKFVENTTLDGEKLPFELFLCASKGAVTLEMAKKELVLNEGEVALVPYDTEFRIIAPKDTEIIWVAADYRVFTNLRVFSIFELPDKVEAKTVNVFELCVSLCRLTLDSEFTNSRMENAMEVNLLLYQLALAVIRKSFPKNESNMVMSRFERLAPVLSHIGEKLDKMCPIGELSEIMELSEDSFYRYFKSTIGQAPKEYLISERLRKARILLASSQVSVTDISKQCGYENPFYFSTLFHGKYGLSPSAYREKTSALMAILT